MRRDDRFVGLVELQLDLVAQDEADLLAEAEAAEAAYDASTREGAEEAYGDYLLVVDAIADRLLEARETYAGTLAGDVVDAYRATFNRAAARRFRRYPSIASDLVDG